MDRFKFEFGNVNASGEGRGATFAFVLAVLCVGLFALAAYWVGPAHLGWLLQTIRIR